MAPKSPERLRVMAVAFSRRLLLVVMLGRLASQSGDALRMINLDAPDSALQGDTIQLSCLYKLAGQTNWSHVTGATDNEATGPDGIRGGTDAVGGGQLGKQLEGENEEEQEGEQVYAIKWYKDECEFFRYVAQDWTHKQSLSLDGISIDLDKSDNQTVTLRNISLRTSGNYRCEVSMDAPKFLTRSIERRMLVYSLPSEGPKIERRERLPRTLRLGDRLQLTCLTAEDKPAPTVDWIINERLNLSSRGDQATRRMFGVRSSRLVRLASASGGSKQIYELLNGSLAVALDEQHRKSSQPVGLTGLLERLTEFANSTLNLTVDADLLQLLKELDSRRKDPPSPKQPRAPRESPEASNTLRVFFFSSSSSSTISSASTATETPAASTSSQDQHDSLARFAGSAASAALAERNLRQPSGAQVSPIERRKQLTRGISWPSNENHQSTLRIKCVARVLHLQMSDEIKLRLPNPKLASKSAVMGREELAQSSQKRPQWLASANSATDGAQTGATVILFSLIAMIALPML